LPAYPLNFDHCDQHFGCNGHVHDCYFYSAIGQLRGWQLQQREAKMVMSDCCLSSAFASLVNSAGLGLQTIAGWLHFFG
jgi:hypothetical protein